MADPLALLSWGAAGWGDELTIGAVMTMGMAFAALPLGIALGLCFAFASASPNGPIASIVISFSRLLRSLPELLTLLLIFTGGQRALNLLAPLFGERYLEFDPFLNGVIALALIFGAFSGEVFLGCYRALPASMMEAAASLGLPLRITLRLIILPEMFRLAAPGLNNLWVSLIKQTSLVSVVGYGGFVKSGYIAASSTSQHVFFFGVICAGYLIMNLLSQPLIEALFRAFSGKRGKV
jgi:polar amino acid transport system permease protein